MMNKHICRAKRVQDSEWVYGYYAEVYGAKPVIITSVCMEDDCSLSWEYEHVDPDTVCRCSGCIDKNGKEIFEKDIVDLIGATRYGCARFEIVKFENGGFEPFSVAGWECTPLPKDCEVISNIVDNPELLDLE